ncbi:hypothetical protein CRP01_22215 [Flavilitoribacter nigricans DSM 23189 = NBRC 102662]|uniref:Lipocalin-like domain-containing protein n=2 Tax=Flavilitoribacter TaxID=2762562 RepID=A0A2D0N7B7_FLAN2|nr:hypothetical protein CRP01_22215 [Flavilitoribacter nigricans DSM 23189 = NBRC 102662]
MLAASLITIFGCGETTLQSDQLVRKWEMGTIMQNGQDVSDQHNPENNRWIELKADGTFVSDGDPYGRNTGKWSYDETTSELFLDSDAGEGDDSYWTISSTGDQLVLKGARSEFTREFSMVWKK